MKRHFFLVVGLLAAMLIPATALAAPGQVSRGGDRFAEAADDLNICGWSSSMLDPSPDRFTHPPNSVCVTRAGGSDVTRILDTPDFKSSPEWWLP